jgi:hypothetical protein
LYVKERECSDGTERMTERGRTSGEENAQPEGRKVMKSRKKKKKDPNRMEP